MHTDYEQLHSAYQQLNDAIEQAPQLFTDPTPYTLPASSLTSAQSFAAQLTTLVEHPQGAQATVSWHFTETACLARVLGNLCGAVHDPHLDTSQGVAATYHQLATQQHHPTSLADTQPHSEGLADGGEGAGEHTSGQQGAHPQWSTTTGTPTGALTLPSLHDEPTGQDTLTLASHFAELDDATIAATATTWRNAAAALHDYAGRLHQAATSVAHAGTHGGTHGDETFAASLGIHEWADELEEFARRSETVSQHIDSFGATYAATRTQLADIAARRQEALEQPAFQTYSFPEAAFTSRADQLLRGTYNPGIQQATLAGTSFPLPQAVLRKVQPGMGQGGMAQFGTGQFGTGQPGMATQASWAMAQLGVAGRHHVPAGQTGAASQRGMVPQQQPGMAGRQSVVSQARTAPQAGLTLHAGLGQQAGTAPSPGQTYQPQPGRAPQPGRVPQGSNALQPGHASQSPQQRGHSKTAPHPHDYGYNPNTNPAVNPAAWPTPRKQSGDPYSPDLHNPVYDPKIREAYQKLFSENRTPDPLATDGRNRAFRRRNPEDTPTFRRREPRSNRILPQPGNLPRGPIRHPDDPLYGTGR